MADDDDSDESSSHRDAPPSALGAQPHDDGSLLGDNHNEPFLAEDRRRYLTNPNRKPLCFPADGRHWKSVSTANEFGSNWIPDKTLVINVPIQFFRPDATHFGTGWRQPTTTSGNARYKAVAALLSLLFAGMDMGIRGRGNYEDAERRKKTEERAETTGGDENTNKKKKEDDGPVQRYTMCHGDHRGDSAPMYSFALEQIFNGDESQVVAYRVWMIINDPLFSVTEMITKVMSDSRRMHEAQRAAAARPFGRDPMIASEVARLEKANRGLSDIDDSANAGLQFRRIINQEELVRCYRVHAGASSQDLEGRPCIPDLDEYLDNRDARMELKRDNVSTSADRGFGSLHPIAPEWLLNGRRCEALEFGLVDPITNERMDVCEKQLSPDSYFEKNAAPDGQLKLPRMSAKCGDFFHVHTSVYNKTPFAVRLPPACVGGVQPGDALLAVFLEVEERDKRARQGDDEAWTVESGRIKTFVDQRAVARLGTLAASGCDKVMSETEHALDSALRQYDCLHTTQHVASFSRSGGAGGNSFVVQTELATDKVAQGTNAIIERVVSRWRDAERRRLDKLEDMLRKALEHARLDPDTATNSVRDLTGALPESFSRKKLELQREEFANRHYQIMKELREYHLRNLLRCFESQEDANTLPAGWVAHVKAMQSLVANEYKGSASLAFRGNGGKGIDLTSSDRSAWGNLFDFLGAIWAKGGRVFGRHRQQMDLMYLQVFFATVEQKYPLLCYGPKGKGKSLRAKRLQRLLPFDTTSESLTKSKKADMNGNSAPDNGKLVRVDEVPGWWFSPNCDEQMQVEKAALTDGYAQNKKSVQMANRSGIETWVTATIRTPRYDSQIVCGNCGPLFTDPKFEPDDNKMAFCDRVITKFTYEETKNDSAERDFDNALKTSIIDQKVQDFRLFTSLVFFCCIAIRQCAFFAPDMSYANLLMKTWDRVLAEEYGLPPPDPRRAAKRMQDLVFLTLMDAVARVFVFKQTALQHAVCARRVSKKGGGAPALRIPQFDIAHLGEALRVALPSRELVLHAWSQGLEYSIATSQLGSVVMQAVCEVAGIVPSRLFRKVSSLDPLQTDVGDHVLESHFAGPGICVDYAADEAKKMEADRRDRLSVQRRAAAGCAQETSGRLPCDRLKMVADTLASEEFERINAHDAHESIESRQRRKTAYVSERSSLYVSATLPSVREACLFYNEQAIIDFANQNHVHSANIFVNEDGLPFKQERTVDGKSRKCNFAWLVVQAQEATPSAASRTASGPVWKAIAASIKAAPAVARFNIHPQALQDVLLMLSTEANTRFCSEMTNMPPNHGQDDAFVQSGVFPTVSLNRARRDMNGVEQLRVAMREVEVDGRSVHPCADDPALRVRQKLQDCDMECGRHHSDYAHVPIQAKVDQLVNRGRLPDLLPLVSLNGSSQPPVRASGPFSIELNLLAGIAHVDATNEASLVLAKYAGLKNRHERFLGSAGPPAHVSGGDGPETPEGCVRSLPYSADILQMRWTLDVASRMYNPHAKTVVDQFNKKMGVSNDPELRMSARDLPLMNVPFQAFYKDQGGDDNDLLACLAHRIAHARDADAREENVSACDPVQYMTDDELRVDCARLMQCVNPSRNDLELYRRQNATGGFLHGVEGDVYSWTTWYTHATRSMLDRGQIFYEKHDGSFDAGASTTLHSETMEHAREEEVTDRLLQTKHSNYQPLVVKGMQTTYWNTDKSAAADDKFEQNDVDCDELHFTRRFGGREGVQVVNEANLKVADPQDFLCARMNAADGVDDPEEDDDSIPGPFRLYRFIAPEEEEQMEQMEEGMEVDPSASRGKTRPAPEDGAGSSNAKRARAE
jgi:hypothetical protein